jgi:GT2 family glycosyltransferase
MLLLGRTGTQLVSGEDDEICYRAWLLGRQTHYVPTLWFKHYMAPHRLTLDYFEKLLAGFAYQSNTVGAYRRCYELIQYRGNSYILFIKKWIMLLWYRLSDDTHRAAIATDTLYFFSGSRYWETAENKQVKRFYDEVVKNQRSVNL